MKNRATANHNLATISALPKSYMALMNQFPLRPIKNAADYDSAAENRSPPGAA